MFKHLPHFLCAFPELFLKSAYQFVILTLCVCEIVVGQLGVLLFELTFDFIPGTFELEFVSYQLFDGAWVVGFIILPAFSKPAEKFIFFTLRVDQVIVGRSTKL